MFKSYKKYGLEMQALLSWYELALFDIRLRYRRTILGPWWNTLTSLVMIFSVGLVWGNLFVDVNNDYLPYFAVGNILWTLISSTLNEGCVVFVQNTNAIKAIQFPIILYAYRLMIRQLIVLGHNVFIIILLWGWYRWQIDARAILSLIGLIIIMITLFGAVLVAGVINSRFRDFQQFMAVFLQLMFFLTPIVWKPDRLSENFNIIVYLNPLYYLIESIRSPILGHSLPLWHWIISISISILILNFGLYSVKKYRTKIVFWL